MISLKGMKIKDEWSLENEKEDEVESEKKIKFGNDEGKEGE
jgi:hypothetical protein